MDKLTAFQMMCHSIALIKAIQTGINPRIPASILELALCVTEEDLVDESSLSMAAYQFVCYEIDRTDRPNWLPYGFDEREPFYGGERG